MTKFSLKEVLPCLVAIFIDILGFGLVSPLLVAFFTSPDHNIFYITSPFFRYLCLGSLLALYPLLMFFGTSFIGDLSDIIGRKKTLLLSMAGIGVSFLLMGLGVATATLFLFFLGRALSGLVSASQSVALAAISDLSSAANKAIHLSYVALVQCIGFVVGPLMGGFLAGSSFYPPFLWSALLAFLAYLWIKIVFQETLKKKSHKTISISRFLSVFVEAYQNRRIRLLSTVFLLMQIGVALYLPVILILLATEFNYPPLSLGLFNGFLGLGFALGLLLILPRMLKKLKIEQVVYFTLLMTFASQVLSSLFDWQVALWVLALPYAIAVQIAFSGMFTSFSNATDATSQGWVMGISVAVMAIAWAVGGFCTLLVPIIGGHLLMFLGSLSLGLGALLMKRYIFRFLPFS